MPNSKDRGKALALISTFAEQDGLQAMKRSLLSKLRLIANGEGGLAEKMTGPLVRVEAVFQIVRASMHVMAQRAAALACPKSGAHAADVQLQLSTAVDAQLDSLERAVKEILADSASALRETSDALLGAICSAVRALPAAAEKEVSDELDFEKRKREVPDGQLSQVKVKETKEEKAMREMVEKARKKEEMEAKAKEAPSNETKEEKAKRKKVEKKDEQAKLKAEKEAFQARPKSQRERVLEEVVKVLGKDLRERAQARKAEAEAAAEAAKRAREAEEAARAEQKEERKRLEVEAQKERAEQERERKREAAARKKAEKKRSKKALVRPICDGRHLGSCTCLGGPFFAALVPAAGRRGGR